MVVQAHNASTWGAEEEDHRFEASLDYSTRVCLKKQIKMRTELVRVLTGSPNQG